jgi:hypothetical protein
MALVRRFIEFEIGIGRQYMTKLKEKQVSTWKVENRYQGCAFLEPISDLQNETLALFFKASFGIRKQIDPNFGEIRFGIKQGELLLNIYNGYVPIEAIEFEKDLPDSTKVDVAEERAVSHSSTGKIGPSMTGKMEGFDPSLEFKFGAEAEATDEKGYKKGLQYSDEIENIEAFWHSHQPSWVFTKEHSKRYLKGRIRRRRFATITRLPQTLKLEYRFFVDQKHIWYTKTPAFVGAARVNKGKLWHIALTKYLFGSTKVFSSGEISYE